MIALPKQEVFKRLEFDSVEDMNAAILDFAKVMKESGEEVPAEFEKPEEYGTISKEHIDKLRSAINTALADTMALPEAQQPESDRIETSLAVTDDEVLDLAASTGVDLDVIMQAAEQVRTKAALVQYVQEYRRQKDESLIKKAVADRIALEELEAEDAELDNRLTEAVTRPSVNVEQIQEQLNLKAPERLRSVAKWGKPKEEMPESQKDFLKMARSVFAS